MSLIPCARSACDDAGEAGAPAREDLLATAKKLKAESERLLRAYSASFRSLHFDAPSTALH